MRDFPTRHPLAEGLKQGVSAIITAGYMDKAMRDFLVARDGDVIDHTPRAASVFIDAAGEVISEVLQDEEGIAYAEIDLNGSVEPKQFHDVVGYYYRFDIFDLSIDRTFLTPAGFFDDAQAASGQQI